MEKYFDSHLHITMKSQFSLESDPINPWRTITFADISEGLSFLQKCLGRGMFEKTFVSQSSPDQLLNANYNIIMAALFYPDKGLLKAIQQKTVFMNLLESKQGAGFGRILNYKRYLELIKEPNPINVVKNDLKLLEMKDPLGRQYRLLKKKSDYEQNGKDTLNLVFTVEGLHCLASDLKDGQLANDSEKTIENLDQLLKENPIKIISINITHIDNSNQIFCNQAYAMDGMRANGFREVELRPTGCGLTSEGEKIIKALDERGILTDTKHMSVVARKELYQFRRKEGITSPIICSHGGLTGIWFDQSDEKFTDYILETRKIGGHQRMRLGKPIKYKKGKVYDQIGFNASTINLFNEDVKEIFDSNGLLGISLDQRVLGYSGVFKTGTGHITNNVLTGSAGIWSGINWVTDTDFVSLEEFKDRGFRSERPFGFAWRNCVDADALDKLVNKNINNVREIHFLHFAFHILHCMVLGRQWDSRNGVEKMLSQVLCIGSDYDGMIESIYSAKDATEIHLLREKFIKDFPGILKENKIDLPQGMSIRSAADRIFFENGRDFVLSRL
ncbi:MAG: hypothetical protein EA341_14325 [Mongoliibacter sp.]|uniref:membrane dipeptidase n=1 Tax=Mongoliibacter sp. TaxID=2022438 RepID=UPI0012EFD9C0|nr:membrane dipeptidase [Mongoliibacter sp.]TVP46139.1 MAG: hypothetical protein EA341_14325 [Mongoliibacter sp.]